LLRLYPTEIDGQDDGNFALPPGTRPQQICAATGLPGNCAQQLVVYLGGGQAAAQAPSPASQLRIIAPLDHSAFILNPDTPPGLAVLPLRAAGAGDAPLEWFVDGQAYQMASNPSDAVLWPATPGRHIFQARTPSAASKPVEVEVQ